MSLIHKNATSSFFDIFFRPFFMRNRRFLSTEVNSKTAVLIGQRGAQSLSTVIVLPALWALNCGAYWHWMVAMPEVNSPGLVTQTS